MALTNAQYDAIMHQYEVKQQKSRDEAASHLAYVYEHIPGYRDLDQSTSDISVSFGMKLLNGEIQDRNWLKRKLSEVADRKRLLLQEAGLPSDYLEPHFQCSDCHDTGYIGNEKCHCFRQEIINLLYSQSNLEILSANNNFSVLSEFYYQGEDLNHFRGAVSACKDFINNFNSVYQNIFFYGTVGTGKSFLSICVAKELLDLGHSVVYFSATDLFKRLSETSFDYHSKDELQSLHDNLYNCELLIIDDLGTELTNSFVTSQLFACLNERYIRHHATVVSTNLSLEDLRNRYSDRIFSRITSNFMLIKLTGPDIRLYKKSHPS